MGMFVLILVIISWVIISIKFGNISTMQILISNLFIFIAYLLYLVKFIRFKKTVAISKQV